MLLISKLFSFIFVTLMIVSCAQRSDPTTGTGIIGQKISESSALLTQSGIKSDSYFSFDKKIGRVHKFDLNTMTLVWSYKSLSSKNAVHGLVGDPEGDYVIDLSTKNIASYNENGLVDKNPFDFQGTPISAAYSPESNYLIVYDSYHSVGIVHIGSHGDLSDSVLLGPLLSDDKSISAGDIDGKGNLILSMSDNSLVVVNLEETISNGDWVYEVVATSTSNINWLAPSNVLENHILATSSTELLYINYESGTTVATDEISSVYLRSKRGEPHIYTTSISGETIAYGAADGSLKSQAIDFTIDSIQNSALNSSDDTLAIFDGNQTIIKGRLSDNLVIGTKSVANGVAVDLGADYFILDYNAQLGMLQKNSYTNSSKSILY